MTTLLKHLLSKAIAVYADA